MPRTKSSSKRSSSTSRRASSGRSSSGSRTTTRNAKSRTPKRALFEPIGMTPTERKEAGEKLPKSLKNTGKSWTDPEVKELKALAKGNTPTRVIGLKLGRSESAVRGKARTEGVSLMPPNRSPYGTARS